MLTKRGASVAGNGFTRLSGDLFDLTVSKSDRTSLDTAILKTSFSDESSRPS
jgi:hypothetical protein